MLRISSPPVLPQPAQPTPPEQQGVNRAGPLPTEIMGEIRGHIPYSDDKSLKNLRRANSQFAGFFKSKLYAANQLKMIQVVCRGQIQTMRGGKRVTVQLTDTQKIERYRKIFDSLLKLETQTQKADVLATLIPAMFQIRRGTASNAFLIEISNQICNKIADPEAGFNDKNKAEILHILGQFAAVDPSGALFARIDNMSNSLPEYKGYIRAGLIKSFLPSFPQNKEITFEAFIADAMTAPFNQGKARLLANAARMLAISNNDGAKRFEYLSNILGAAHHFSGRARAGILASAVSGINLIGITRPQAEHVVSTVLTLAED